MMGTDCRKIAKIIDRQAKECAQLNAAIELAC